MDSLLAERIIYARLGAPKKERPLGLPFMSRTHGRDAAPRPRRYPLIGGPARRELRIRNIDVRVVADPNAQEPSVYGHNAAAAVYKVEIRSAYDVTSGYVKGVAVHRKERNDA